MSEELMTLVQVLELYGRGVGALGKAIRFSAKGVHAGIDIAKLKNMQRKMKLHYASEGTLDTMKVKDLEELTGGNYRILNIPLEDEKELIGFYDRLKKMNVSFAELPDLCIGDGYTQIAYNPQDTEKIKLVVEHYRKHLATEPTDITLEDYEKLGGTEGKRVLDELATKGYKTEQAAEQIERIHGRMKDKDYEAITLNFDSILLEEHKDRYYFRVPKSMNTDKTAKAICIMKKDVLILDEGKSAFTHLKKDAEVPIFNVNADGFIDTEQLEKVKSDIILKNFNKVESAQLTQANRIKVSETEKLPDFNKGQGMDASARTKEQVAKVIHFEDIKARQGMKEYLPISIDMDECLVAENKAQYVTKLPEVSDLKGENAHCLIVEKTDAVLSDDGRILSAYLKKGEESKVKEIDKSGDTKRTYMMKNEKIAAYYLKAEELKKNKGRTHEFAHDRKSNGHKPQHKSSSKFRGSKK